MTLKIIDSKEKTSYIKGRGIPKGCKLCLKGEKTVLFINGCCQKPSHCSWYCPISEERKDKISTFANEIKIFKKEEILEEIHKCNSKGISITGGEPLFPPNLDQTLDYIQYIKSQKGEKFHIHLYTNGINFNESIAQDLANAGLDEIRFNPSRNKWSNIKFALNKGMSVGAEVPIVPAAHFLKEIEDLIFFLNDIGANFINFNEFEYCFPNSNELKRRGFKLKEGTLASVENSSINALNLINKIGTKVSIKMHFCPIITKDYYQLKNRYSRRAKTIKRPYEDITEEGLLIHAEIKGKNEEIKALYKILTSEFRIPISLIEILNTKLLLPVARTLNEKFISMLDNLNLDCDIIEIIPFREEKYYQITESTPIRIFMKEINRHEMKK